MEYTYSTLKQRKNYRRSGASLTELALVFVVAAAIIAVVSVGGSVIENAKYSNIYGDISQFTSAVEKFYTRFNALPGDLADVSELDGATAGNGNGVIDSGEERDFWQHLQLAGLIEGNYGGGSSNVPGVDLPEGPFDSTAYSIVPNANGEIIIQLARVSNAADDLSLFTPEDAEAVDARADDGKPATAASRIRGLNGSDAGTDCFSGSDPVETVGYDVSNTAAVCILHFVLNPYIKPTDAEASTPACPRLGATRVSDNRACPRGYPGKIIETCRPSGWVVTDITCSAAVCAGEREYVYKDQRVESCPKNYEGAVLRECSESGVWVDAADQGEYVCQPDTSACSVENLGRILPCPRGSFGGIEQTCTAGVWSTSNENCTEITCPSGSSALGTVQTSNELSDPDACAGNYRCRTAEGDPCQGTDGIFKSCSMTGAAVGQWEIVGNSCAPKDYDGVDIDDGTSGALLPESCDPNAVPENCPGCPNGSKGLGCPLGEIGQNNFRCVEVNDEGDTGWEPLGVNTCRPLSCGDHKVGSIRESREFSCPDGMAGNVFEVCNICEDGEPCWSSTENRGKALWEVNYSNCAASCSGSSDTSGYAYWPNAPSGTNGVRSVSCIEGYFGVAIRNCESVSAANGVPPHGKWTEPSKACFLPPFSLSGLTLWLDANSDAALGVAGGGALVNDAYIETWYDSSAENIDVNQTDSNNYRPQYKTSGINGKPSLYFDGNDNLHSGNSSDLGFERTDDFSGFVVSKDFGNGDELISKQLNGGTARGWAMGAHGKEMTFVNTWNSSAIQTLTDRTVVNGAPNIYAFTYDGSSTAVGVNQYINGYKLKRTVGYDSLGATMVNDAYFRVGARGTSDNIGFFMTGHIGEVLVYELALSDSRRRQVEEYLATKWDIPIAQRFETMEGLTLWLDANNADGDFNSETNPPSSLQTWVDVGPFRNNATQSTSSARPGWQPNKLNGKPGISFDGTSDYMVLADHPFSNGNSPYSALMVFEVSTGNSSDLDLVIYSNGNPNSYQSNSFQVDKAGNFRNFWVDSGVFTNNKVIKPNTPYIVSTLYDTAAGPRQGRHIFVNGENKAFDKATDMNASNTESSIGRFWSAYPRYFAGTMYELMMYDKALTDDERQALEQYLSGKWNIPVVWSPKNIGGLKVWLDGDQAGAFADGHWPEAYGGSGVWNGSGKTWKDKSGNNYDATVTNDTASYHPTTSTMGGRGTIFFAGADRRFNVIHPDVQAVGGQPHSYFIVAKPTAGDGGYLLTFSTCDDNDACNNSLLYIGGSERVNIWENGAIVNTNPEIYLDRIFMASVIANPNETKFYIDGKLERISNDAFASQTTNGFRLGYRIGSGAGSNFYEGHIGEVILYGRELNDAEREAVEAYLGNKWPLGESWAPTKIQGLELWLDADDASKMQIDYLNLDTHVMSMENKAFASSSTTANAGGQGIDLVQDSLNGRSTLRFDGAADSWMLTDGSVTPKTIVMVHKSEPSSGGGSLILDARNGGNTGQPFINNVGNEDRLTDNITGSLQRYVSFINGAPRMMRDDANTSGTQTPTVYTNQWQILTLYANTSVATPMYLYRYFDNTGANGKGNFAEVLTFNRHITLSERLLVENYLSEKWGIAIKRPNLNSPAYSISGLALWLDASDENTIGVREGDVGVSAWANKSNVFIKDSYNSNNITGKLVDNGAYGAEQHDSAKQPTWVADGISVSPQLPGMYFDNADSINVPDLTLEPNMTLFVAGKFATSPNQDVMMIEHGPDASASSSNGFYAWGGPEPIRIRRSSNSADIKITGQPAGWYGSGTAVNTFYNNGSKVGYYTNNSLPTSQTAIEAASNGLTIGDVYTDKLYVGSRANASNYTTLGHFAEILLYDRALSVAERKTIEDFLVGKWILGINPDDVVSTIGSSRDITVWLDASDTTHMSFSSGNNIEQVNDAKGATPLYHAKQDTASSNPLYVPNVQNGQGVMRFDGVDDELILVNNDTSNPLMLKEVIGSASDSEDDDFTLIAALSVSSATHNDAFPTSNQMVFGVNNATGNVGLAVRSSSNRLVGFTLADGLVYQSTKSISFSKFYVTSLYQGAGYLYFDVDGVNVSKQPAERIRGGIDTASFSIGGANPSAPFKGDIGEFITFGKMLQQNEREDIETYLGGKWGVAITTGADGASSFTDPKTIEGLTLWLDADDVSTLNGGSGNLVEGTAITAWEDKSDNELDMTNSGSVTYQPNFLNNKGVLKVTGAGARMESAVIEFNRIGSNNQITAFEVYRAQANIQRSNISWFVSDGNRFGTHFPYNGGSTVFDFGDITGGGRASRSTISSIQEDVWMQFTLMRTPANESIMYLNGELFHYDNSVTDQMNGTGTSNLQVARLYQSATDYVAEVLVYNSALEDADRENVENYLMTKWGIGSGIANDVAYTEPDNIAGLKMWVDAADLTSIHVNTNCTGATPADGETVKCWKDKSSKAAWYNVAMDANRPVLKLNQLNGQPGVIFDGANDGLETQTVVALDAGDDNYSIFAVWVPYEVKTQVIWEQNLSTVVTGRRGALVAVGAGGYGFNGESNDAHDIAPYTPYEPNLTGMIVNNGSIKVSHNGYVYNGSVNATTANLGADYTFLGKKVNNSEYFKGAIHEVIVYDSALSDTDRTRVESYLSNKWLISSAETSGPPSFAKGLTVWLDASDASTINSGAPTDGQTVTAWKNKAGNPHAATFTSGSGRTFSTSGPNGLNTISANGSYSSLSVSVARANFVEANQGSIVLAQKSNATASYNATVSWIDAANKRFSVELTNASSDNYFDFGGPCCPTNSRLGGIAAPSGQLGNWRVMSVVKNTAGFSGMYMDGRRIASKTGVTSTLDNTTASLRIMHDAFDGEVGEILIYRYGLSDEERSLAENYLMDKWLPKQASSANSDLTLWLDASDFSTINEDGDPQDGEEVERWYNKADNDDIEYVEKYSTQGPTFKANQLNGLPVLNFAGNSSQQKLASGGNISRSTLFNTSAVSVFAVQQAVGASSINTSTVFWQDGSNNRLNVHFPSSGNLVFDFGLCCGTQTRLQNTILPQFINQWHVMSAIKNGSTKSAFYMDGVEVNSNPKTATVPNNMGGLLIGGSSSTTDYFFKGNIAEILVYRTALGEAERLEVESYLQEKWRPDQSLYNSDFSQANLTLWLDAADMTTLNSGNVKDGDNINVWYNKATNLDVPSVSNTSNTPSYYVDAANGLPGIRFHSGSSERLTRTNVTRSQLFNSNETSLFIAQNALGTAPFNSSTIFWQGGVNDERLNVHIPDAASNLVFDFGPCCAVRQQSSMPGSFLNNWHVISAVKAPDETGALYLDGAALATGSMATTVDDHTATFYVGSANGGYYFNGFVGEIMLYRKALSNIQRQEVENYLIGKWVNSDQRASAQMVQPANLALWLDASDNDTLAGHSDCTTAPYPANGEDVGCWMDKSGNGRNVVQDNSAANKPHLKNSAINGRQALDFTASAEQHFMLLGGNHIYSSTGGLYIFAAAQPSSSSYAGWILDFGNWAGESYGLSASLALGTLRTITQSPNNHGGVQLYNDTTIDPAVVLTAEFLLANSQSLYMNGQKITEAAIPSLTGLTATQIGEAADRGPSDAGPVTIGGQSKNYLDFERAFNGAIGEVLVYNNTVLSNAERQAVENYLMTKWGINDVAVSAISNPQTPNSLVLWLDASDDSTINGGSVPSDFGVITEWRDKSDNANRAIRFRTSGDSGVRYRSAAINGEPSIGFDAIPLQIENSENLNVASDATWFMVTSSDTGSANQHGVLLSKGYDETNFRLSWDSASSKGLRFCSGANAATCTNASNGFSNMQAGTPYVTTYRYKAGTPGRVDFYKKGGSGDFKLENVSATNSVATATGSTKLMIGAQAIDDAGAYTQGFRGNISELLMYNYYLHDTERRGVESYLMSKWGLLDIPKTVTGLTLWLDANDANTVNGGATLSQGGTVTRWDDKSENGLDMTSAGGRIRYGNTSTTLLNGKPVMAFNTGATSGTGFVSEEAVDYRRFINRTEATVFMVAKRTTDTGASLYWWQNGERFSFYSQSAPIYDFGYCCSIGVGRYQLPSIPTYLNTWWVFTTLKNGNNVSVELDSNAQSLVYNATLTEGMDSTGTDNVEIGSYADGTALIGGSIAEVLIYRRALSVSERTAIRRYLGSKWGIAVR